jgi:predicted nucleotidyltransferase component of viral defense system
MLQKQTVEPNTLLILKKVMAVEALNSFFLVGGTCLSLRYGHRTSVDLDFFSVTEFINADLVTTLSNAGINFNYNSIKNPVGLFGFIDNVKVDFVKHHHFNQIDTPQIEEGIRLFGDKDIAAMKIFAILQRAQKKDFWDMAELLQHYSLAECIDAYHKKYPNNQMLISIPNALLFFSEADESEDPISLKGQTWESVKKIISEKVSEYLK